FHTSLSTYWSVRHLDLHSFPTRRSSDLRLLSAAGANIEQLNTVRQQLSTVKAGGLARACNAARLITLLISDVLGDRLDIIGSGPDRKSTRLNSSHQIISYAVFCLKKKNK